MDDRKKTIRELEEKRQENQESAALMLADLGEALLGRAGEGEEENLLPHIAEYRRLLGEIAGSEALIRKIGEDTARLRELEEDIQRKETQNSGQSRELSAAYIRLGELVFEDPEFESFAAPSRTQAEGLTAKIRSLEERLESFEDKNGANVFAWISKGAQSMVIRSFLAKTQENLRRFYASSGENFFLARQADYTGRGEAGSLIKEIGDKRKLSSELSAELVRLRGERRKIGDAFGAEGSPAKQIQGHERHIRHIREELRKVFLAFGELAADPGNREGFASLLRAGDQAILDRLGEIRGIIAGINGEIGKIEASLAIDDETAAIEQYTRTIGEYRQRIAAAGEAIADLEKRIGESDRHIEELRSFLDGKG